MNDHNRGFTLVEVIIVMVVIGVMATIAVPSFVYWLPNIRLKNAARDLYTNMQEAKINAIKENKDWAIIFSDDANDRYSICDDSGDGDWTTPGDNNCIESVTLATYKSGIQFGRGNSTTAKGTNYDGGDGDHVSYTNNLATFDPRGFGSAGYVYIQNEDQTVFAVGTPITGAIRLFRWKGSDWE